MNINISSTGGRYGEAGEQFFSPSTVEQLQPIILNEQQPDHFTEVPVYYYVA
ncbi:MAG: hypothetical protein RMZ43_020470 [Nostoc sp. CmiVER01]|uniref:hypothetical protein n=1 Tax=Nostoc sp. CmiVER01 TaxID=3075384 RepID=UPI002AD4BC86|nr:hypothetical protein [Nostoc sp. CmiVER01]MDZ8125981.1 hypothetical protein [Nostoc sp. CmiVER01]